MIHFEVKRGLIQIIGANVDWVYPHYYPKATLDQHKNHVHIGWGVWP